MRSELKHCKHSSGSLEGLDASLPNDCAFCAHEQLGALADALAEYIAEVEREGWPSVEWSDANLERMRAALRAAGRLP